jgi:hypothetical protein
MSAKGTIARSPICSHLDQQKHVDILVDGVKCATGGVLTLEEHLESRNTANLSREGLGSLFKEALGLWRARDGIDWN